MPPPIGIALAPPIGIALAPPIGITDAIGRAGEALLPRLIPIAGHIGCVGNVKLVGAMHGAMAGSMAMRGPVVGGGCMRGCIDRVKVSSSSAQ